MSEQKIGKSKRDAKISVSREVEHTVVTAIERVEGPGPKRAYILFLSGPLVGKLHMLAQGKTVLGRSREASLVVSDNRVSRQHVEIHVDGDRVILRDLGSTNGTFVNGQKVREHALVDGDKVQISSVTIFKYALQDHTENVFHKELYKMAVTDPVTTLYNKRYFLERLKEEFSHARRTTAPLAMLMIDIDFFKRVNDTHGHLAGDMVLHQVAQTLKGIVRTEDLLCRYGGEEFSVLLRDADTASAAPLAERMRAQVAAGRYTFEGTTIPVTISLGVAAMTPQHPMPDPDALVHSADQALYASKQAGRNRVTVA
ncbi:MAG: GGDEF domain-containing protein [Deltaproteobacteria bacterium]|nr:GGDEF domain-containing protein [Deltaproteobacteria bacterium]